MVKTLIQNGTLLTMDPDLTIIGGGSISIEDQVITKIFTGEETAPREGFDHIIDATGKIVLPGFINAHGHVAMTLLRSYADDMPLLEWLEKRIWPLEAKLEPEDVYWGTLLGIMEMLKGGTTTFVDMYFFMDQVADATLASGMRGVLSRGMVGVGTQAEEALRETEELFQNFHQTGDGRVTITLGPHAPYTCPPAYLQRVLKLRERLNIPLQVHLAETEWEVNYCQENYQKTPVSHLESLGVFAGPTLAAHCVHLTAEDIEILAKHDVKVAHNPGSNLKLGSGIAPLPEMLAAGIDVGLGTDGASSNNNLDMLEEIRLAALIHKGTHQDPMLVPAEKALEMATRMGGRAVFNERIGSLEEGKLADISIFNYAGKAHLTPGHNPLSDIVYAAQPGDVEVVMVNGRVLCEKGRCLYLDEERIIFEAIKRGYGLEKKPPKVDSRA